LIRGSEEHHPGCLVGPETPATSSPILLGAGWFCSSLTGVPALEKGLAALNDPHLGDRRSGVGQG
jgi:hypothetical protein